MREKFIKGLAIFLSVLMVATSTNTSMLVHAEENSQVVENEISTEENSQVVENEISTEENSQVVENETSTEENSQVVENEANTEENSQVVENEANTEENSQVVENETSTEENSQVVENETSTEENSQVVENETSTEENSQVVENETSTEENNEEQETFKVYEGEGYKATYTLFASWEGGSNFQIEIENTGDKKIENWCLLVAYEDEINNIWNAQIINNEDGKYKIKNAGWNQDIEIGDTVSFGMSALSAFTKVPTSITLLDNSKETKTEGVVVDYVINNQWDNGCTGSISITNLTEVNIEDWSLEFDCVNESITFWDGNLISQEGNHYVIHNAGYNWLVAPGETISVGFQMNGAISENLFTNLNVLESIEKEPESNIVPDMEPDEEREKEPLGDIGENYFKQPTLEDVVLDEESGLKYVRNQLLVSAYMGTPKEAIVEIAEELGAEIVGYTAITCDYQFEFNENMTLEDLEVIADYLEGYPYISGVFLNTVVDVAIDGSSDDSFYNDGLRTTSKDCDANGNSSMADDEDFSYVILKSVSYVTDDWNESNPEGDNWGLEALHVPSAWDLITDSHTVKVGIIDNYFSDVITQNGKRELVYDDILRNRVFDAKNHGLGHGNHVAGIIGATHNNQYGISGVATDVRLYGYTMSTSDLDASSGVSVNCMAGINVALNSLVCNNVKVINMSLGYAEPELVYGASEGNANAIRKINTDAYIATEHLRKLTDAGYDFLIVKSAGNYHAKKFIKDSNDIYGYHVYDAKTDDASKIENNGVKAEYGYYINAIIDPELKARIIVVGAFAKNYYKLTDFSGRGTRLDVVAPGESILSTVPMELDLSAVPAGDVAVPGFGIKRGTSMATPYITGIAALMYQVKPSISAKRVKENICKESNAVKKIEGYKVPDAKLCVEDALRLFDTPGFEQDWPTGLAAASIRDGLGNKISGATFNVQAIRHSTGDYNLDRYSFNFTADADGDFTYPLPQGTYDFLFYISGTTAKYLPTVIKDVEILPEETNYMGTIRLSVWASRSSGGNVMGIVNDAFTGTPLSGVTAKIRKGWNVTSGAYVTSLTGISKTDTTDMDGTFTIAAPIGAYTVELKKDGYITTYYNVLSTKNNGLMNGYDVSMSMTPVLPEDEYRIVLSWGSTPSDLDSHLLYYKDGSMQFHVYYGNKNAYLDGERVASLDLDDVTAYGPETTTITVDADLLENGELRYCVHNFSGGSSRLSESNASVRIYRGNELVKTYSVTQNKEALVWHVFNINKSGIQLVYDYDNSIY